MASANRLTRVASKIIAASGLLTIADLAQAEYHAKQTGIFYIEYLVNEYHLADEELAVIFSQYLNLTQLSTHPESIRKKQTSVSLCEKKLFIYQHSDNDLHVLLCDPDQLPSLNTLTFIHNKNLKPILTSYANLRSLIDQSRHKLKPKDNAQQLFQRIFDQAISKSSSDIHIESFKQQIKICFRIDGILNHQTTLPIICAKSLINYLKIYANLNITEHRLPQDGRMSHYASNGIKYDCRLNFCPTIFGERVCIRILEKRTQSRPIDTLGLNPTQMAAFHTAISKPQGLILITGPTGSGKTNTLYAALENIKTSQRNILTIEDPVEIILPGINQCQIKPAIDFTFATALRAFLRQDPDVIMIGEIRDKETAGIAITAAQTGHLVLASMHCNSHNDALSRLTHMGISKHYLSEAIICIASQRLVRLLCPACKQRDNEHTPNRYHAIGCVHCSQGYHQRTGIFEIAISENPQLIGGSLWENALTMVQQGITSYAEIQRVCISE